MSVGGGVSISRWSKSNRIRVWIHGGGFRGGFKELGEYACRTIAARGYVTITVNYRLAPKHKFPAAVNDGLGAIVWAKKHAAKYNGDPNRIAVAGESAATIVAALTSQNQPSCLPLMLGPVWPFILEGERSLSKSG